MTTTTRRAAMFSALGIRVAATIGLAFMAWPSVASQGHSLVLIDGDVTIAAMLTVNNVQGGQCGPYDVNSVQELVAVTWFVESLNEMDYMAGFTIGLEAYRTCEISVMATQGAVELLNKYHVGENDSQTTPLLFGVVGPDRTSDAMATSSLIGSLPANQRILQISGSATGEQLGDKTRHPSFFRVIPPDNIQIQVMLKLLLQLRWNYVAIVYADDDYERSAATELRRLAEGRQLCVPVFASLPFDTGSSAFATQASSIAQQLKSGDNGLVRGLVVLGGRSTVQQLLPVLQQQANFVQLVLSEAVGLDTGALLTPTTRTVALGALVTSPPYLRVPEFTAFWNQLWGKRTTFNSYAGRNAWLRGYFYQITNCDSAAEDCWNRKTSVRNQQMIPEGGSGQEEVSLYTGYQVKATAVLAALLKRFRDDKCGSSSSGLCPGLRSAIVQRTALLTALQQNTFSFSDLAGVSHTLANMSAVSFDSRGDVSLVERNDGYDVFNLKKSASGDFAFQRVGTLSSDQLIIDKPATQFYDEDGSPLTWDQLPPAQCEAGHDCLRCEGDVNDHGVIFIEGDFYVLSIIPVHTKNPGDLLKCGPLKALVGADIAQAVIYAVRTVNEKKGQFRDLLAGRTVGLVGIDSCTSSLLVRQKLMDFFSGRLRLPDGRNSSSLLGQLVGVLGAFYSSNSIAASDTLTTLGRPFVQVSAASTSPDLKDRNRHPYFMRLVPPDDKQAQVLLDIVQNLGANYIQMVYDSSTAYATALFHALQTEVTTNDKYKICIAQSIPTTPHDSVSQYVYIMDTLRIKSSAKVVLVLLHTEEINKVMDAILPLLTPEDNFLFLASESWGRRQKIIQGRTKLEGSLILSQEIAVDQLFQRYFAELDPSESMNPWLQHFWEVRFNCYMDKSFYRKGKTGPCPEHFAENYEQDSRVPFHIQAVYALVKGFDAALKQHCGPGATSTCESLTSSRLVSAMHEVLLDLYSTGRMSAVFDDNGDGLVGYNVLKVSLDLSMPEADDVVYEDVGQWTVDGLTLEKKRLRMVTSVCPNAVECDVCFTQHASSTPPNSKANSTESITNAQSAKQEDGVSVSVTAGLAAALGLIIIILTVVIVWLVRRRKSSPEVRGPKLMTAEEEEARNRFLSSVYTTPGEADMLRDVQMLPLPPRPCFRQQVHDYLTATVNEDPDQTSTVRTNPAYQSSAEE